MSDISKTIKDHRKSNNFHGKAGPGRPKGMKNKKTIASICEIFDANNFNPIQELINTLPTLSPNGKVYALEILIKYAYTLPKDTSPDGTAINITYKVQD